PAAGGRGAPTEGERIVVRVHRGDRQRNLVPDPDRVRRNGERGDRRRVIKRRATGDVDGDVCRLAFRDNGRPVGGADQRGAVPDAGGYRLIARGHGQRSGEGPRGVASQVRGGAGGRDHHRDPRDLRRLRRDRDPDEAA